MCRSAPRSEEECGSDALLHHHDTRSPATAPHLADSALEGTVCVRVCVCACVCASVCTSSLLQLTLGRLWKVLRVCVHQCVRVVAATEIYFKRCIPIISCESWMSIKGKVKYDA